MDSLCVIEAAVRMWCVFGTVLDAKVLQVVQVGSNASLHHQRPHVLSGSSLV